MTFPNVLTVLRILILVPFVAMFYIHTPWATATAISLYCIACLTDYFDGVIARHNNQVSRLGKFLDPIADKLLISTTLLMLAGNGHLYGTALIPALIILCRELFVSGFREHLSLEGVMIPVSALAKWKTGIQMVSLSCLLAGDMNTPLQQLGIIGLWFSAGFSIVTGWEYWQKSSAFLFKK
jgi:cardiolipin synthase